MTRRIIYSRLDQALTWPRRLRRSERLAEVEIDLQRQTGEAFGNVEKGIEQGIVIITLQRAKPRADGMYRPKLPWALATAIYPIWRGLEDTKLLGHPVDLVTRIRDCEYEDECILVELIEV